MIKTTLLAAAATATLVAGFAPQAQAATFNGTCQFNNQAPMACTMKSGTDYYFAIIWADGVTEEYKGDGTGVFVDQRGGHWSVNANAGGGEMFHRNGNVIRYMF